MVELQPLIILGARLMVGQRTLTPYVGVQLLRPQPKYTGLLQGPPEQVASLIFGTLTNFSQNGGQRASREQKLQIGTGLDPQFALSGV